MQEMKEMWVQSLGWEDPLEEEVATHSSILAWGNPMDREVKSKGFLPTVVDIMVI